MNSLNKREKATLSLGHKTVRLGLLGVAAHLKQDDKGPLLGFHIPAVALRGNMLPLESPVDVNRRFAAEQFQTHSQRELSAAAAIVAVGKAMGE